MKSPSLHTSMIQRTDYLIATAMLLMSMVLLFSASWVAGAPKSAEETLLVRAAEVAQLQCVQSLQSYGVPFSRGDGARLEIAETTLRPLSALMERASLVQKSCPGYELESLCAGESCTPAPGLHFTLTPSSNG